MIRNGLLVRGTVALSLSGVFSSIPVCAADSTPAAATDINITRDVALGAGGVLTGQLVDPAGTAQQGGVVVLLRNGVEVASATTDAQGAFVLTGVSGGAYQMVAGGEQQNVRLWLAGTAPPAAVASALVVRNGTVARGQWGALPAGMISSVSTAGAIATGGIIGAGAYAITQADSGS